MKLFETLESELKTARLAQDSFKRTLLSTIIGEIDLLSKKKENLKKSKDDLAVTVIKAAVNNNLTIIKINGNEKLIKENEILEVLLPKVLDADACKSLISEHNLTNIGQFMQYAKANGLFVDGNIVKTCF